LEGESFIDGTIFDSLELGRRQGTRVPRLPGVF
jgi:hypothetical protein